eukprot:1725841-Rhodomonas_salina.1
MKDPIVICTPADAHTYTACLSSERERRPNKRERVPRRVGGCGEKGREGGREGERERGKEREGA